MVPLDFSYLLAILGYWQFLKSKNQWRNAIFDAFFSFFANNSRMKQPTPLFLSYMDFPYAIEGGSTKKIFWVLNKLYMAKQEAILTTKAAKCALWAKSFCLQMSSFGNSTWRDYRCLGNKNQICFCWAANPIIINAAKETRGKKMRRHFLMIAQNFVQNQIPILDPQWLGTLQHHSLSQHRGRSP